MALPASGAISVNAVNTEAGLSATATTSFNDVWFRALTGTTTGTSSLNAAYSKSTITVTISANTLDFNLHNAAITAGWNGTSIVSVICNINTGIYVGSSAVGTQGFVVGSFPTGSYIRINNSGYIFGKGAPGGAGGASAAGVAGTGGGTAFITAVPVYINNTGVIAGGGGGGGGGGAQTVNTNIGGSGGGAGQGYNTGAGGAIGVGTTNGLVGNASTVSAAGAGGSIVSATVSKTTYSNGAGGAGGTLGQPGASGGTSSAGVLGGAGGAAGAAISGNANITWIAVGTLTGAVA
jgi:hypothetical protein